MVQPTKAMRSELLSLLSFLVLCCPTVIELYEDRRGDFNKKWDTIMRALYMLALSFMCWGVLEQNFFTSLNLSIAIFFLVFDYAINIILYRNEVINDARWFSYTGKSGVIDNIGFWKKLNPWVKLAIRIVYFGVSLYLFLTLKR